MCETVQNEVKLHPFESAGLGEAPFRFVGMEEKRGPIRLADGVTSIGAPGQPMGSCDYCGQGIAYCCNIQDRNGTKFVVGLDCVRKVYAEGNRLLTEVERARAKIEAEKREAKRQAAWDEKNRLREIELQAQRDRNGGLTDHEVAKKREQEALAAKSAEITAGNQWLIDELVKQRRSDFIVSMLEKAKVCPVAEFSPRMIEVLRKIYASSVSGKTSRSKDYQRAEEEFDKKIGADECDS